MKCVNIRLCLHYTAKPYWYGMARYGTAKDIYSVLSQCTVPYRSQRVRSEQQVWCGTLRYDTSKYLRVNTSRADAISLQVVQCIAEGDMLSAESVGGMSTWTSSGDISLLSAAEVFEVYVFYVQGGRKKRTSSCGGPQR